MSYVPAHKRKIPSKSIIEKYKILKEVDKGSSSASEVTKYIIPKQTLSNWIKKRKSRNMNL